jgi:F-type H+-transporting ATPase subunit a
MMILAVASVIAIKPVQPHIQVAPENLLFNAAGEEQPLFPNVPFIGDIYLVNTLPTLVLTILLILGIAFAVNRSVKQSEKDLVPHGIGGVFETLMEMLYNLTEGSAGAKWAPKIFPWFATIMIYVLFANLLKIVPGFETIGILHKEEIGHATQQIGPITSIVAGPEVEGGVGLIPFFRGISVDLNFTFALALIAVIFIQVIGFQSQGFGYLSKFFNTRRMFSVPFFGAMDFLVGLLELISELSKILSFAFRLFGNMFAGVVLVAVVGTMLNGAIPLFTAGIVPSMLMLFEIFVGVIQAFVFGMLTMVFMAQATVGHGGEEHAESH